jgi:class 3 adenylate cyclase
MDEARIDAGPAAYRGLLFSDVRNFTAFAERYGNTAAAAMVNEVERSVRAGVGEHPRALADHYREREQGHLVDKVVVEHS